MSKDQPKVTFEHLIAKVQKAEDALEYHEQRFGECRRQFKAAWRSAWTPGRIVAAGLVTGFLTGRAEPLGAVGGARWLQMISSVAGLFSTAAVAGAAEDAENAAELATSAAAGAAGANRAAAGAAAAAAAAGGPTDRVRAARPYTGEWQTEPRPAEAATEVSER